MGALLSGRGRHLLSPSPRHLAHAQWLPLAGRACAGADGRRQPTAERGRTSRDVARQRPLAAGRAKGRELYPDDSGTGEKAACVQCVLHTAHFDGRGLRSRPVHNEWDGRRDERRGHKQQHPFAFAPLLVRLQRPLEGQRAQVHPYVRHAARTGEGRFSLWLLSPRVILHVKSVKLMDA